MAVMAAGGLMASSAQAASCWNADEVSAANVRELQSMLMVAALRCQVAGHPMMDDYNKFVSSNRTAIGAMNDKLKGHFVRAQGPVVGQRGYDSFTTSMANSYGSASSTTEVCASAAAVAREGALMAGSVEGLLLIADRQGVAARLTDGRCGEGAATTVASAKSTTEAVRR
jgi:hypothetical protein